MSVSGIAAVVEAWTSAADHRLRAVTERLRRRGMLPAAGTPTMRATVLSCNDFRALGGLAELDEALKHVDDDGVRKVLRTQLAGAPYDPLDIHPDVFPQLPELRRMIAAVAHSPERENAFRDCVIRDWPYDCESFPDSFWVGLEWLAVAHWGALTRLFDRMAKLDGGPVGREFSGYVAREFPVDAAAPRAVPAEQTGEPPPTYLVVRLAGAMPEQGDPRYDVTVSLRATSPLRGGGSYPTVVVKREAFAVPVDRLASASVALIDEIGPLIGPNLPVIEQGYGVRCIQVEFLLEHELLDLGVDQWAVRLGRTSPRELGVTSPVVIRPLHRMRGYGVPVGEWLRRWKKRASDGAVRWVVARTQLLASDEVALAALSVVRGIEQCLNDVVCLGIDAQHMVRAGFRDELLDAGLPGVVWSRDGGDLEPLRAAVREAPVREPDRLKWLLHEIRTATAPDQDIKVTLLWDDPEINWETTYGTLPQDPTCGEA